MPEPHFRVYWWTADGTGLATRLSPDEQERLFGESFIRPPSFALEASRAIIVPNNVWFNGLRLNAADEWEEVNPLDYTRAAPHLSVNTFIAHLRKRLVELDIPPGVQSRILRDWEVTDAAAL